jgi:hypothetical protein
MKQPKKMRLPYMNNATAILLTLGINLAIMVALNWGKRFGLVDVLLDAAICGVTTSVINVFFVRRYVTRALENKTLPANLPVSRMMMRLQPCCSGRCWCANWSMSVSSVPKFWRWRFSGMSSQMSPG